MNTNLHTKRKQAGKCGGLATLAKTGKVLTIAFFVCVLAACSFQDLVSYDPYAPLQQFAPTLSSIPTQTPRATNKPTTTAVPKICKVNAQEALNLRAGPNISYTVLYWLKAGEELTLMDTKPRGAWIEVSTQSGMIGWVHSEYCQWTN